jgi:hypothetical protein
MTYVDTTQSWDERPALQKDDARLFPHVDRGMPSFDREKVRELSELRDRISTAPQAPEAHATRDTETEKLEILKSLRKDGLLPDAPAHLANHINAFLFLAFFPLGLALYCYGRVFGTSLRVALTVFFMWWLNFAVVFFLL